jgi:hypothetical protein
MLKKYYRIFVSGICQRSFGMRITRRRLEEEYGKTTTGFGNGFADSGWPVQCQGNLGVLDNLPNA